MAEILLILFAWTVGGFICNLSGMGAGIVAVPLIALLLPLEIVIPVSCICGTALGGYLSVLYVKHIRFKSVIPLFLGALPGTLAGIYVLYFFPKDLLFIAIGCMLMTYALWQLRVRLVGRTEEKWTTSSAVGFLSGFSNSSTSFGGPPGFAYAVFLGWDRKTSIGTLSFHFLLTSIITMIGQYSFGFYDAENLGYYTLLSLVGLVVGIIISIPFVKKITLENYRKGLIFIIFGAGLLSFCQGIW